MSTREIYSKHDRSVINVLPSLSPTIHHGQMRNAFIFVYFYLKIKNVIDIDISQYNLPTPGRRSPLRVFYFYRQRINIIFHIDQWSYFWLFIYFKITGFVYTSWVGISFWIPNVNSKMRFVCFLFYTKEKKIVFVSAIKRNIARCVTHCNNPNHIVLHQDVLVDKITELHLQAWDVGSQKINRENAYKIIKLIFFLNVQNTCYCSNKNSR